MSPLAQQVRREHLTYLSPAKLARLERTLASVLERGVPGDVLEFGVALGGSAIVLAANATQHQRSFHGFDVFAMIPAPTSDKDDEKSKRRYEVIASGQSQGIGGEQYYGYRDDLYGEVVAAFGRYGLSIDHKSVSLHKGLFEDAWPACDCMAVAFAHIDCDWYEPVKFCLEALADTLVPGGAIVLDDYHAYGGAKIAADEFLQAHDTFTIEDGPSPTSPSHRYSVVRKTAK